MKAMTMVVAAALLAGCATPYQASGLRGGYTLLRSAEVALEQGFGCEARKVVDSLRRKLGLD